MSTTKDYSAPLDEAFAAMREQMAKPENIAKESWHLESFDELLTSMSQNMDFLLEAVSRSDRAGARRRAANIANFAWMIADKVPAEEPIEA